MEESKTKFTLENCIRLTFSPTGVRDFITDFNKELDLGPYQSRFNYSVATLADYTRLLSAGVLLGLLAYKLTN